MCELAAERLDPLGADGTMLVKGDMICRRCLVAQIPALREALEGIHWIELALFVDGEPRSLVATTEAELEAVEKALSGN